jgi:drug/metabolite transporter (DMT)-like permease
MAPNVGAFIFMLFPVFWRQLKATKPKTIGIFFLNGFLVALHWLCFYGCIKLSNSSSLALACFGSIAAFTAFLEPIILKTRFYKSEVFIAFMVFVGLYFVAKADPNLVWSFESNYFKAVILGVVAAFWAALFSIINKKYIADNSPTVITWAQMIGGFTFLSALLPLFFHLEVSFELIPSFENIIYLLLLSIVCTNIAFSMEMEALKKITAFKANLILNLEPIYGILLALWIFKEYEILNFWFYLGAFLIIISVFVHPFIKGKGVKLEITEPAK